MSKMKKRADIILEKLQSEVELSPRTDHEEFVPTCLRPEPPCSKVNEADKENCTFDAAHTNGAQKKLNTNLKDDLEKETSGNSSSSVIEDTPQKSVSHRSYTGIISELPNGKRNINESEVVKTARRRLTFDNYEQQNEHKIDRSSNKDYCMSPINKDESDVDLSDDDPTYRRRPRSRLAGACKRSSSSCSSSSSSTSSGSSSSSTSSDSGASAPASVAIPPVAQEAATPGSSRRSRKRKRNPESWKQNLVKRLRNSVMEYVSLNKSKEVVPARSVKNPCTNKCRLKCTENINDTDRKKTFDSYWAMGSVELQRSYIRNSMVEVKPKYKYTNSQRPRQPNSAFYFTVNDIKIRVCKTFFINTLDICDKVIRTVKSKTDAQGFVEKDQRGKHEVNRKKIDPKIIEDIKNHINSIPRIESHYLRCSTSREYIGGEKTIMDLWRVFDKDQREAGKPSCLYWLYSHIFNTEFNLGFFQPKKDRCDLCFEYENAAPERKSELKEKFDKHLEEKNLARNEKLTDRINVDETHIVAVFDLQAVMQCPSGEISAFYYKSKLNCLNFTIVELSKKNEKSTKKKLK